MQVRIQWGSSRMAENPEILAGHENSGWYFLDLRVIAISGQSVPIFIPRCLAGSGAPPPEENPTQRKYNFLPGIIRDIGRLSPPTRVSRAAVIWKRELA